MYVFVIIVAMEAIVEVYYDVSCISYHASSLNSIALISSLPQGLQLYDSLFYS